jgi:hypothetical protein
MDELYTFTGKKKTGSTSWHFFDRATRCILAWMVRFKRSGYEFQEMLVNSAPGHDYYSNDYEAY